MAILRTGFFWTRMIVVSVMTLTGFWACVGTFETKLALTAVCDNDWQRQVETKAALPVTRANNGFQVLVFNIHDRLLPYSLFSSEAHSEEEVVCIGDLASRYDLVLLQEAFVRPAQVAQYTGHAWADYPLFTEGGGGIGGPFG